MVNVDSILKSLADRQFISVFLRQCQCIFYRLSRSFLATLKEWQPQESLDSRRIHQIDKKGAYQWDYQKRLITVPTPYDRFVLFRAFGDLEGRKAGKAAVRKTYSNSQ